MLPSFSVPFGFISRLLFQVVEGAQVDAFLCGLATAYQRIGASLVGIVPVFAGKYEIAC